MIAAACVAARDGAFASDVETFSQGTTDERLPSDADFQQPQEPEKNTFKDRAPDRASENFNENELSLPEDLVSTQSTSGAAWWPRQWWQGRRRRHRWWSASQDRAPDRASENFNENELSLPEDLVSTQSTSGAAWWSRQWW